MIRYPWRKRRLDEILTEAKKRRVALIWSPTEKLFVGFIYLTKSGRIVNPKEHDFPC